jgi:hypothetical protein
MRLQQVLVPISGIVMMGAAWLAYGWGGVAAATGAIVMWALLHLNRTMQVLKRAADRPIGYVASAVMLNAKLKPGMTLLHVMALTRALGQTKSDAQAQPELFRWTDGGDSWVDCEFTLGKLTRWKLVRPGDLEAPAQAPSEAPPAP